jgi:glutathione S-transferase
VISQALNRLYDELEGRTWLCGDRFSAADILLYGLTKMMVMEGGPASWLLSLGRKNVEAYLKRMDEPRAGG